MARDLQAYVDGAWRDARDGLLEEGRIAEELDELLGSFLAADGPEALAAPAGHDDDETVASLGCLVRFHRR